MPRSSRVRETTAREPAKARIELDPDYADTYANRFHINLSPVEGTIIFSQLIPGARDEPFRDVRKCSVTLTRHAMEILARTLQEVLQGDSGSAE